MGGGRGSSGGERLAAESKRENKGCVCTEFKSKSRISSTYIKQFTARLAAKNSDK